MTKRTDSPSADRPPKPNGHALHGTGLRLAAPVDAGGLLVASATSPVAAGANRDAYAEVAASETRGECSRKGGNAPRAPNGAGSKDSGKGDSDESDKLPPIPPGEEPLPLDGRDFVEAVHEQVDLIAMEVRLLRSKDEKIVQRELAYLRELRYGKSAASQDDEPTIVFDLPRPKPSSEPTDSE